MERTKTCFAKALHYTSPAHGGWGMVRIAMSVPESYQIFFAPAACGRHGAISAVMHGYRDRLAYYFLEEKDIISGGYEEQIFDAVRQILRRLDKKPKAVLLFVTCIDDLMGTDLEALTQELEATFEGVDFTFCHMDPIRNDSKLPPPQNIHQQMYRLLKPSNEKKKTVNCIGNLMPVHRTSELYRVLELLGLEKVYHIRECEDYKTFQEMASSQCNLMLAPTGLAAVKWMEKNMDFPYLELCTSYDLDRIAKQYGMLQEQFGGGDVSEILEPMRRRAEEEVEKTKELFGELPIYIDQSAVNRPYELAYFLHRRGFSVKGIFADKPGKNQEDILEKLLTECPQLELMTPQHPKTMLRGENLCETFAIGFEGAYIMQCRYVLNLFSDEGMFGYDGVIRLIQMMQDAYKNPVSLQELLDNYGLVV